MPRYIDADAFFADFSELRDYEYASQDYEVDAVSVVRCKECKHSVKHQLGYGCGMNYHLATNGNWFCADGEERG